MIKDSKRLTILIMLSVFILANVCCIRHSDVWQKMDEAEEIMNSQPEGALEILDSIKPANLGDKEERARYALLKSMALDKNCIDTVTFDVLQPALDYYIAHGTVDEKLRTYYYQGRIYQNKGDDDSAMSSFMKGYDLKQSVKDSLLLAHTMVALGTLYIKQYKTEEFISNNLYAAKIYEAIGKETLELKSYTNALNGYIILDNKSVADSLLSLSIPLARKNPDSYAYLFSALLSYTVEFGSAKDIKIFLDKYQDLELTKDETINFAFGYSKIGEYDKAFDILSGISPTENILDSLKYSSVKIDILERQGKYEQALKLYRNYSAMLSRYQKSLLSQDLLFSDKKHRLEMSNLVQIQKRDRIIWGTVCGICVLVIIITLLYYRSYRNKVKCIVAEKENLNLKLEQDNLRKEIEKAELERDNKILEANNLENDKKRLEAEKRQHELEAANLKLEIARLEDERDNLKELQKEQSELSIPVKNIINERLNLLNGLLAKAITNNENYAEPFYKWIETARNDRKKFMDSTRLAFAASNPKFIAYLEQHGLTKDEINYLCLYAIGLRGKEVGEYIQLKRHYTISHEIRKKLGIDEHETNIGIYIRRLLKDFENDK
ncbi:MAG: hypothetical protein K2K64_00815 [Muribaculaceae bacterium]|nr:hypothetical protein [Muribaculaceae bacterium]